MALQRAAMKCSKVRAARATRLFPKELWNDVKCSRDDSCLAMDGRATAKITGNFESKHRSDYFPLGLIRVLSRDRFN